MLENFRPGYYLKYSYHVRFNVNILIYQDHQLWEMQNYPELTETNGNKTAVESHGSIVRYLR